MKKSFALVAVLAAAISVNAWEYENPGFEWSVGTDITSAYLWRGIKLGGLALQPDVTVGYGGLNLDVWANISPADYTFKELAPELDLTLSYTIAGLTLGVTHQYYFDHSKFFDYRMPVLADYEAGNYGAGYAGNQTEVFAKFELGEIVESVPLNFMWATYVGGDDWIELYEDPADEEKLTGLKRAYSSYIEISYDAELPLGFTLTPTVGMTPWTSMYNYYEGNFSVNNISLKLNWEHEFGDHFTLDVYALGMLNTAGVNKENLIPEIKNSYCNQRLNGAIGIGLWFN